MTTEENFDLLMAKQSIQAENLINVDSDDDSNYGGSDVGGDGLTTFRMLFEKISVRDSEFVDRCQHGGIVARNPSCMKCFTPLVLVEDPLIADGVEWCCQGCSYQQSVRHGSWFADIHQCRLKDILLILYCWSRNYSPELCQHELELTDVSGVSYVYSKCHKLAGDYFQNEISSIGSNGEVVEIEQFRSIGDIHIIGGVERKNTQNVFFRVLPEDWTRDDLVTAIADNIAPKTVVSIGNPTFIDILDKEGVQYLEQVWNINVEKSATHDCTLVKSEWISFEKRLSEVFSECNLVELLFRRRMETADDPFLFLLSIINRIHPISLCGESENA